MDSIDPRKQKRLGPAPIASFEKSFEDSSMPSAVGMPNTFPGNLQENSFNRQNMDSGSGNDKPTVSPNIHSDKIGKDQQPQQQQPKHVKYERPKISPPDPPPPPPPSQQSIAGIITATTTTSASSQPKNSSVSSTPTKKLHYIGGRKPPLLHTKDSTGMTTVSDHPLKALGLAPITPRIDISRASSSSQHEDSRESSPENVFEQVGTGTLQEAIGLGFREEGALDLRSSTEELYFMDPEQKKEEQEKMQQAQKSPITFKFEEHQLYLQQHQRKDSASSEVAALLCISGRTSRVSSVGSQGSAVSRLSAISGVSRSPSPHRMLMETSFCGPKPLENLVDGSIISSVEPPTAEILEHVLLSRTKDPTQVILAEGIKIECSPMKKPIANGEPKRKPPAYDEISKVGEEKISKTTINITSKALPRKSNTARRDSSKQIIGVTPTGTEYIRINLKPDHLYADKGVAPNEHVIELEKGGGIDKPSTLKLGTTDKPVPHSSPKPARHVALTKDQGPTSTGSRSPSPAIPGGVSRKSSFCSLFKTKDSPDSPRDRSRSKSRERSTPQSQSGTPSKQKSVLAIFKPKRSGSKSKSSSPIDQDAMAQLDGISQVEFKFNESQPSQQDNSRPASRLRYYDTPSDGKSIHIPLHTPPDEKESRKVLPGITQEAIVKQKEQLRPMSAPTTRPSATPITNTTTAAHSAGSIQKETIAVIEHQPPALPIKSPKPQQLEKIQRIENLDAIHTLPEDLKEKERTWSLEVHRHSSQDSQDTVASDNSSVGNRRISKPNLDNVIESPLKENGLINKPPLISQQTVSVQQSQQQQQNFQPTKTQQPNGEAISKEKKRILFATRIGSGSQEQIFSTQFSLSKTESLSSQLSEQTSIPESPAEGGKESLHRTDTVLRRPDDFRKKENFEDHKPELNKIPSLRKDSSTEDSRNKSKSSDDDDKRPVVVLMRKKDSSDEGRKRDEDNTNRHSKYFENFDVTKPYHTQHQKRQSLSRNSSESSVKEVISQEESKTTPKIPPKPARTTPPLTSSPAPHLPPPPPMSDRHSVTSTDEPGDTSESERDSEMDPNRVKKHLPRHLGVIEDHESTGLVSQVSFEDELPYVPTTLPEERTQGVALIPMKERTHMDVKTFSLDRPRSTTPMNPAHLEEYCEIATPDTDMEHPLLRGEKLRISLPRKDSATKERAQKSKSPRRTSNASGKSWFEFAEQGIRGTSTTTTTTTTSSTSIATITTPTQSSDKPTISDLEKDKDEKSISPSPPPPLPPRKPSTTSIGSGQWVNFENIPEKRKPPKRITALPKDSADHHGKSAQGSGVQYNYVKPEECQCECHESERDTNPLGSSETTAGNTNSIASVDLLKQSGGEDLQPLLDSDCPEGIYRSDSSQDDYGPDEHQNIINERRRAERPASIENRSSGYSDQSHESPDERYTDSTRQRRSPNNRQN